MTPAARAFRDLHAPDAPVLVLPNVWDAASAALVAAAGARAVATTSAGMAWALGWPDGNALPADDHLAAIHRIARVVDVPVTADIEGGYADDPARVADFAAAVAQAGAVGINIEDGGGAPEELAAKVAAVRTAVPGLFINVRTDVYLRSLVPPESAVDETLTRAAVYREAGADGLFVPGVALPGDISRIAAGAGLPLNVMALPGLGPAAELGRLGVRRLSLGPALCLTALSAARRAVQEVLASGDPAAAFNPGVTFGEMNALLPA